MSWALTSFLGGCALIGLGLWFVARCIRRDVKRDLERAQAED
jgi:hypothetical protein